MLLEIGGEGLAAVPEVVTLMVGRSAQRREAQGLLMCRYPQRIVSD